MPSDLIAWSEESRGMTHMSSMVWPLKSLKPAICRFMSAVLALRTSVYGSLRSSTFNDISSVLQQFQKWLRRNAKDVSVGVISGLVIANVFFLNSAYADVDTGPTYPDAATVALMIDAMQNELRDYGAFPVADDAEPRRLIVVPITAYTSDAAQTDSTPCIAARGFDLCAHGEEDVIAANFLPMGTKVKIPELYGSRVFTVVDRMNARYDRHVDVWMREYDDARAFGMKLATIEVF